RFADGLCSEEELERAGAAARVAAESVRRRERGFPASLRSGGGVALAAAAEACALPGWLRGRIHSFAGRYQHWSFGVMRGIDAAAEARRFAAASKRDEPDPSSKNALLDEQAEQCRLLRDVVGDPFHPVRLDPAWHSWEHGFL